MCIPVHRSTVHGSSMDGIIDGGSRTGFYKRRSTTYLPAFLFFPFILSLSLCSFSSSSCSRIANVLTHRRGKHPVEGVTRNRLLFPFKLLFLPSSLPLLSLTILLTKKEKKQKRKKTQSLILPRVSALPCTHYYIVTSFDAASTVSNIIDPPPQKSVPPFMAMSERSRKRGKAESWKEAGRRQDPPVPRIFHPLPLFEQPEEDLREGKTRQSTRWSHTLSVSLF